VGALLYELLTNCRPFSTRMTLEQLLVTIASTPPVEPGRLVPEAPASLCGLALRLLAKEPGQRPPSARAVREELERLREQEGHSAAWQAPARWPSEDKRVKESFPDVDVLEAPPGLEVLPSGKVPSPGRRWPGGWPVRLVVMGVVLGLLGLGWMLLGPRAESTAPVPPAPSEKGTQPVPSPAHPESTPSLQAQAPSRWCALLTSLLGVSSAQLAGCATAPVRPDPIGYLASCSPEARATPVKLGITPEEIPSFVASGTPASEDPIVGGGSLNVKPGPVTATVYLDVKGQEVKAKITGVAETLPHRLYMRFDHLHLPDGTTLPICGVALDGKHQYGIATWAKFAIPGSNVDPARVDPSPGSVVLNDPRFETVLQGPEGSPMPRVRLAPPNWR
jgi:serine/threonine-protein kinase